MMLADTRYRDFFEFHGEFGAHYGVFPGCGTEIPFRDDTIEAPIVTTNSSCC